MKDFFVSYNHADQAWAEWIAWALEEAGYTTILQAWDFRPGSNFVLEMDQAAAEAERTVAVLSPDYVTSGFTQPEWAAAFAEDPKAERGTLLPVRVRELELPRLLRAVINNIDLVWLDEAEGRDRLLAGISRERARPTAPPAFPAPPSARCPSGPVSPGRCPPSGTSPTVATPTSSAASAC